MARSRNLKPGFFLNEILAECQPLARILFEGLWVISDREGRLPDRPKRIKAEVLPHDNCDVDSLLNELASKYDDDGSPAFIIRYQAEGHRYIQVVHFTEHQNPHIKEAASIIPAPDKSGASIVQTPDKHGEDPADSLLPLSRSLLLDPDPSKRSSSPPDGVTPPEPDGPSENEEDQGKSKKIFPENSVEYSLAFLLRSEILRNLPDARVPRSTPEGLASWCNIFDKMIRIDKRGPTEIRAVITWCQRDSFWLTNILGAKKLREKWETLVLQSKREEGQSHGAHEGYPQQTDAEYYRLGLTRRTDG